MQSGMETVRFVSKDGVFVGTMPPGPGRGGLEASVRGSHGPHAHALDMYTKSNTHIVGNTQEDPTQCGESGFRAATHLGPQHSGHAHTAGETVASTGKRDREETSDKLPDSGGQQREEGVEGPESLKRGRALGVAGIAHAAPHAYAGGGMLTPSPVDPAVADMIYATSKYAPVLQFAPHVHNDRNGPPTHSPHLDAGHLHGYTPSSFGISPLTATASSAQFTSPHYRMLWDVTGGDSCGLEGMMLPPFGTGYGTPSIRFGGFRVTSPPPPASHPHPSMAADPRSQQLQHVAAHFAREFEAPEAECATLQDPVAMYGHSGAFQYPGAMVSPMSSAMYGGMSGGYGMQGGGYPPMYAGQQFAHPHPHMLPPPPVSPMDWYFRHPLMVPTSLFHPRVEGETLVAAPVPAPSPGDNSDSPTDSKHKYRCRKCGEVKKGHVCKSRLAPTGPVGVSGGGGASGPMPGPSSSRQAAPASHKPPVPHYHYNSVPTSTK